MRWEVLLPWFLFLLSVSEPVGLSAAVEVVERGALEKEETPPPVEPGQYCSCVTRCLGCHWFAETRCLAEWPSYFIVLSLNHFISSEKIVEVRLESLLFFTVVLEVFYRKERGIWIFSDVFIYGSEFLGGTKKT